MTMQTTTPITRVDLDPLDLLVDVNIRTDARLDKDFVASIKDFGVLVPIIAVRTAGDDVRVRFGHRRHWRRSRPIFRPFRWRSSATRPPMTPVRSNAY